MLEPWAVCPNLPSIQTHRSTLQQPLSTDDKTQGGWLMLNPLSAVKLLGQALWPLWLGDNKPIYMGFSGDITCLSGDKSGGDPNKPLFLAAMKYNHKEQLRRVFSQWTYVNGWVVRDGRIHLPMHCSVSFEEGFKSRILFSETAGGAWWLHIWSHIIWVYLGFL